MYKVKLAQWKLSKTYRKNQKKQLLLQLAADQTRNYELTLNVNEKPLKPARLTRKVMEQGKRRRLSPTVTARRLLEVSMTDESIETALHVAKNYFTWYFHQNDLVRDFGFGPGMDHVFSNIASARRVVDRDVQLAIAMMDTACIQVEVLMIQQPFQLIQHIMSELGAWQWSAKSTAARTSLARFFVSMATRTLGSQHALCKVISVLLQRDMKEDSVSVVVRLLAEIVGQHMQDDERGLDVYNYLGDTLFHAGDLTRAKAVYSDIIERGETFGAIHRSCRRAFRNLGWLHFRLGERDRAQDIWFEVNSLNTMATGAPNADFGGVCTCGYLGALHTERGEDEQAERFLRLAFEGYFATSGDESSGVFRYLESLESNLARQGKIVEIAELRSRYSPLWLRWEKKKLVDVKNNKA